MFNSKEKELLIEKFINNNASIGIIGLGYVGLPLALLFAKKGLNVTGIDLDQEKVDSLNNGRSYIHHVESNEINNFVKRNLLKASSDFSDIQNVDGIIICVPTPLDKHEQPDISFIENTLFSIKPYIKSGQILSLESTTYPGTTEEVIKPLIEEKGLSIGVNFFLVFSPEREDPGNKEFKTKSIPKLVGGITRECGEVGKSLYECAVNEVVLVSNSKTAEMTKLLENIHRAVNIGLMNELKPIAEALGIDLYEVINAAATKPFGFVPYYPGPGLGGHCIPIDPFYLSWKAKEFGMRTRFIELAGEINSSMPYYVINKTVEALNQLCKSINSSKILVLGLAYKKNVDDMRESPSIEIINQLIKKGSNVSYNDPFIKKFPKTRKYCFELESIPLTNEILGSFDAVILATDHDIYNYEQILSESSIIIDTRGRYGVQKNVIRA